MTVAPLPLYAPSPRSALPGVATTSSVFDRKDIRDIEDEVRSVYLTDSRPWVIGYSGGKDSTTVLQLVWNSLSKLRPEQLIKPVYVIASDTLVETPVIVERIDGALDRVNEAASATGMPFSAHKVQPAVQDTFWVNLIGKGYPAPSKTFRWCTDRLKIKPANRFILDRVAEHGEVIMVLGVRAAESATRAQVMSLHRREGSRLARHSELPNAFVYAPIEGWLTDDVWTYLLQVPSPFGQDNRDLVALYTSAQAGECPLVIDKTTPSCGNSRFGCWVCTVVERDRTMEALVDNGEDWLEPLLDFRQFLADTQDPSNKQEYRGLKRRDGQIRFMKNGDPSPGPYRFEFCKDVLRRVLELQKTMQNEGPDPDTVLITSDELHEIRRIWRVERQDWDDSVPDIYRDVMGADLDWIQDDSGRFTKADREMLEELAMKNGVPVDLVVKLIEVERSMQGLGRRSNLYRDIDRVFNEEWRNEDEIRKTAAIERNRVQGAERVIDEAV